MRLRWWTAGAWSVVCLVGLGATVVLDAERPSGATSPTRGPAPGGGTAAVDCREVAEDIARARAEALRERREALDPSAAPTRRRLAFTATTVPKECADELAERGVPVG
ncbi:hypothetical protein [Streptomyces buecherae]|uniref:hypothetical protein n=1 Tax=Streptomyces buecherae TaxID=2763006 RepID=UPI003673CA04